jgi:hypothetical protein
LGYIHEKALYSTLSFFLSIQPLFAAMTGGGGSSSSSTLVPHQTLLVLQVIQIHLTHPLKVAAIVQKKIRRRKSLIRLKAYMD